MDDRDSRSDELPDARHPPGRLLSPDAPSRAP
jgi:hypothetical protein